MTRKKTATPEQKATPMQTELEAIHAETANLTRLAYYGEKADPTIAPLNAIREREGLPPFTDVPKVHTVTILPGVNFHDRAELEKAGFVDTKTIYRVDLQRTPIVELERMIAMSTSLASLEQWLATETRQPVREAIALRIAQIEDGRMSPKSRQGAAAEAQRQAKIADIFSRYGGEQ